MVIHPHAKKWSSYLHFVACAFLIIGVCCSKFLMSMGLLIGGISFFSSGEIVSSTKRLFKNPYFQLLFGFYALHLLGLVWSENLTYGWNDVRQKSSLVIIPIIVLYRDDWSQVKIDRLLQLFLATLSITALVNFSTFFFFKDELQLVDIRSMSLFESHIRFGILIGLGAGVTLYFMQKKQLNIYLVLILLSWFGFYSYYSQVLSGILSFLICLFVFSALQFKKYRPIFYSLVAISILCVVTLFYYLQIPVDYPKNEMANHEQLANVWNAKSTLSYDSLDAKAQPLKFTLIRYLSSKSLTLDAAGVSSLTDQDINYIEKGYADVRETSGGIPARLFQVRYELQHPGNPNLHPITERLELWRNAWFTIQKSPLIGVGNGDIDDALQISYDERESKLIKERRLRAHQSYLTFWLAFGLVGIVSFLWLQGYFLIQTLKNKNILALCFGLIALVTFLFEDTLETQAGITFFSFFYALFSIQIGKTQTK
ncbi:MAG: O-antigen ligase family protein [Bacteroidetes bacterium]|nr:O-antigen ligase family protein [Bacteroidota bacterium]